MHSAPIELSALLNARDGPAREAAWQVFVAAYSPLLLRTARTLDRDHDAAMDAYTYLLEKRREDEFRRLRAYSPTDRSKFTTWLVVVARRLCLDHLRHRYGRSQTAEPESVEARAVRRRLVDHLAAEIDSADLPDGANADPHAQLRAAELSRNLADVLRGLDPRDQLLLTLRFADELAAREIALMMKFPTPYHVYRRLAAVLEQLRAALVRRGIEESEP